MPYDNEPQRKRGLLIPILIAGVVVLFVVLHLTGVFGPGSH
jgi:hypothetical protein